MIKHQFLVKIEKELGLPRFVKEASKEDFPPFPAVFADYNNRKYPCETPAQIYTSAIEWKLAKDEPRFGDAIWKYAADWNIQHEIKRVWDYLDSLNVNNNPVLQVGHRKFHLKTAADYQQAAKFVISKRHEIPLEEAAKVASFLLENATANGIPLLETEEELERLQGGKAYFDTKLASAALLQRKKYMKSDKEVEMLDSIARILEKNKTASVNPELGRTLAILVDKLDKQAGIGYTEVIPPEIAFQTYPLRTISREWSKLVRFKSGSVYHVDDLKSCPIDVITYVVGYKAASDLSQGMYVDPYALASWTMEATDGEVKIVEERLKEAGVLPRFFQGSQSKSLVGIPLS